MYGSTVIASTFMCSKNARAYISSSVADITPFSVGNNKYTGMV